MAYCAYCTRPEGAKRICMHIYTPTVQHLSYAYAYKPTHSSIENPLRIPASLGVLCGSVSPAICRPKQQKHQDCTYGSCCWVRLIWKATASKCVQGSLCATYAHLIKYVPENVKHKPHFTITIIPHRSLSLTSWLHLSHKPVTSNNNHLHIPNCHSMCQSIFHSTATQLTIKPSFKYVTQLINHLSTFPQPTHTTLVPTHSHYASPNPLTLR